MSENDFIYVYLLLFIVSIRLFPGIGSLQKSDQNIKTVPIYRKLLILLILVPITFMFYLKMKKEAGFKNQKDNIEYHVSSYK